jgi:hypothetical protein
MANQKYTQVIDLVAGGWFNWQTDPVLGILLKDASYSAGHKKLSEVQGQQVATTQIQGRAVHEGGQCMGYPAIFQTINGDTDYQLVLVQDLHDGDPNVLAFYDTGEDDGPLHLEHTGTFIVRPGLDDPLPEGTSSSARLWMRL